MQPVWVYTNQPEVELFVNGSSAGTLAVENRMARWDIALADGANGIRARAGTFEDRITIMYEDRTDGAMIAVNAGADYAHLDESHVYWEPDRAYVPGSWGYVGGKSWRTHHRIFGTDEDPLYQSARIGMERYQFDVADGVYEVTLGLSSAEPRTFAATVNGRLIPDINLHEPYSPATRSIEVEARAGTGIRIDFLPSKDEPSVASIMVRRIH